MHLQIIHIIPCFYFNERQDTDKYLSADRFWTFISVTYKLFVNSDQAQNYRETA